ncbi:MAG: lipoyl synthase [Elusimicrobiales bacterium]|nr:lipoyl synthase [Elusimicrobiales bacterium]
MNYPKWIIEEIKEKKNSIRKLIAQDITKDLYLYQQYTICYEAKCPNKGECFNKKHATFLILGKYCSRQCKFCSVEKGIPTPPDPTEPIKIAELVKKWDLRYVVFTSPTRDDLKDGGASQFALVVNEIKKHSPLTLTEPLIPDLSFNEENLKIVLESNPSVLAHNIETVERLYDYIRPNSSYKKSLKLLEKSKKINPKIPTKSSIIIGMGEKGNEIKKTIKDLKEHGCDIVVIGQYLKPSLENIPVEKYYTPKEFEDLKNFALSLGFKAVVSRPLARSSYNAFETYLKIKNNKN